MFTPGRRYNRREELHKVYGGQRQGGISTPTAHPLILIFTGEQGELYGYEDGSAAKGMGVIACRPLAASCGTSPV